MNSCPSFFLFLDFEFRNLKSTIRNRGPLTFYLMPGAWRLTPDANVILNQNVKSRIMRECLEPFEFLKIKN